MRAEFDLPRLVAAEFREELERFDTGQQGPKLAMLLAPCVASMAAVSFSTTVPVAELVIRAQGGGFVIAPATRADRRFIEQWSDRGKRRRRPHLGPDCRDEPIILPSWSTFPADLTSYQAGIFSEEG